MEQPLEKLLRNFNVLGMVLLAVPTEPRVDVQKIRIVLTTVGNVTLRTVHVVTVTSTTRNNIRTQYFNLHELSLWDFLQIAK